MYGPLHHRQKDVFFPIIENKNCRAVDDDSKDKKVIVDSPVIDSSSKANVATPPTAESCTPATCTSTRSSSPTKALACDAIACKLSI